MCRDALFFQLVIFEEKTMQNLSLNIPYLRISEFAVCERIQDGYKSKIFQLLSGIINADGIITTKEFEIYKKALNSLLKESDLQNDSIRIVALQSLLSPVGDIDQIIQELKQITERDYVSLFAKTELVTHVLDVLLSSYQADASGFRLAKKLVNSLEVIDERISNQLVMLAKSMKEPTAENISCDSSWGKIFGIFRKGSVNQQASSSVLLSSAINTINKKYVESASNIQAIANVIGNARLIGEMQSFTDLLRYQPVRIVLAGEIKHGKSTLFNAIMMRELSQVGESIATTTAVIELSFGEQPSFEGVWMDHEQVQKIRDYIKQHEDFIEIRRFADDFEKMLRSNTYRAGQTFTNIDSLMDVGNYSSSHSPLAQVVKKIRIKLPLPLVANGVTITDTPGINDPRHVRDLITLEESLTADVVVFVMRADKFGTESERQFLEKLVKQGRMVKMLLVITHIDRVMEKDSIVAKAQEWLSGVSSRINEISICGIFPIDVKTASQLRCGETYCENEDKSGFPEFLQALDQVVKASCNTDDYELRVHNNFQEMVKNTKTLAQSFLEAYDKSLPDPETLNKLRNQAERFEELAQLYTNQIRSRVKTEMELLEADFKRFQEDFDSLKNNILTSLKSAIEAKVRELGDDYLDRDKWVKFDNSQAQLIVKNHLEPFYTRWNDTFNLWNRNIHRFSEKLEESISVDLQSLYAARSDWAEVCLTNANLSLVVDKVDHALSVVDNFTKAYVIGGAAIGLGTGNFIAFTSIASILTATNFLIPFAVAIAAYFGLKLILDGNKRKEAFIQKKVDTASENINKALAGVEGEVKRIFEDIADKYRKVAEAKYTPIIQAALLEAHETKLQVQVIERLRQDAKTLIERLLEASLTNIHEIGKPVIPEALSILNPSTKGEDRVSTTPREDATGSSSFSEGLTKVKNLLNLSN